MTRLLVIGLDGGTNAVIRSAGDGLPHLAGLRRDGISCVLRSTVPPVTAAAWPSMFTGWNPGRHGMYDFRAIDITRPPGVFGAGNPAGFAETAEFVGSDRWRGAAVWDVAGVSCRISCVPMTYPPWPVNGEITAGFPLPDYTRDHAAPPASSNRPPLLEGADLIDQMDDAGLAAHCRRLADRQAAVIRDWVHGPDSDLIVGVFQAIDFAQHRLWRYLDRPGHPLRAAVLGLYGIVDELVGEARSALGSDGAVVVLSDHGFGPHPRTLVRTDAILAEAGLLTPGHRHRGKRLSAAFEQSPRLRRHLRSAAVRLPGPGKRLLGRAADGARGIDWPATKAYRYPLYGPAEGVVVNLEGRSPYGRVGAGDYERVRDRAIEALVALTDDRGDRPVLWALRREDVFQGPHTTSAPDVIALFDPTYKPASGLGGVFDPVPHAVLERHSGVHTMDGIFLAAGAGLPAGVDLGRRELVDVAPTLLAMLGRTPRNPCDGRSMIDAAAPLAPVPAMQTQPAAAVDPPYTAEQADAMERSLRALGYLE